MSDPSEAEVCNLALRHLGHGKEITNLETEATDEAAACRRFFEIAREQTLRDFHWPFATKFADLSLVEEEPTEEWGFSYTYPSDCLMLRRIMSGSRTESKGERIAYRIVNGTASRLIYTDEEDAEVEYTVLEDDPVMWPPDFRQALALRLAAYIAPSLTRGDPLKLGMRAIQLYDYELSKARANSANEEQADEPPDSEFIRERG